MKKVLIITYYWPPSGGPGVQRVLKFAKYLPKFGWQPIILTVNKGNYPSIDQSLVEEIPSECKVYKTKSFEPFELYKSISGISKDDSIPTFELNKSTNESLIGKFSKWVRANVFVPDAKVGWVKHIVNEGKKIVEIEKPDLIFSSSPPHSLQIGAMKLAKAAKLKWVADFRDPWTDAFWQKDLNRISLAVKRDKKLERKVIESLNHGVTTSNTTAENMFENNGKTFSVITNGFDEEDFLITKQPNNKFTITYAGTLGESQKIDNFLSALTNLDDEIFNNLEINFYGSIHSSVLDSITRINLTNKITVYKDVSHSEIIQRMMNSNMNLLVIPKSKSNKGIIPGKIFEYMASGNFILGIGPKDGDAARILQETNTGKMFFFNDELTNVIEHQYKNWIENKTYEINKAELTKFTREYLTKQLAEVFNKII